MIVGTGAFLLMGVLGGFFVGLFRGENTADLPLQTQSSGVVLSETVGAPSPTPFLFQEMTIPYLRTYTFSSNLAELRQYAETNTYVSYLTSYMSDNLRINGLLTIPKGERPADGWPAVVFVHGYIPPASYSTTENYAAYVDYLARNGVVVFKIDLRGHGQSEGEAGGGYYSGDYVIDTLYARAALMAAEFVNPHAVGLWGHSMAGNIVLRSMASKLDIPAAVIWAGAVYTYEDMQAYGIDDTSYRPPAQASERQRKRQLLRETYGDFNSQSLFWRQVAPTDYLQDFQGALALHHAVDDSVVSIEYSRNLTRLLSQNGVEYELYEYTTGGHNLSGASFNQAMRRTVDFYTQQLNREMGE